MAARLFWIDRLYDSYHGRWEPVEAYADYNSPEEALLQAAHQTMKGQAVVVRIESLAELGGEPSGEQLYGEADLAAAVEAYREARADAVSLDDQDNATIDSARHLERMAQHHRERRG